MNKALAAVVLGLITVPVLAAGPGQSYGPSAYGAPRMQRAGQDVDRLAVKLGLTEEQKVQVEQIYKEQAVKRQALQKETQDRLDKVLTPEQSAQMQQMRQQRAEKWRQKLEQRRSQRMAPGAGY